MRRWGFGFGAWTLRGMALAQACVLSGCLYSVHHFNTGETLGAGKSEATLGAGRQPLWSCSPAPPDTGSVRLACNEDGSGTEKVSESFLFKGSVDYRLGIKNNLGPFPGVELEWHVEGPSNPATMEFGLNLGLPSPTSFRHKLGAGWGIGAWADNSFYLEYALSKNWGRTLAFGNARVTWLATQIGDVMSQNFADPLPSRQRLVLQSGLGLRFRLPNWKVVPDFVIPQVNLTWPQVPSGDQSFRGQDIPPLQWDANLGLGWSLLMRRGSRFFAATFLAGSLALSAWAQDGPSADSATVDLPDAKVKGSQRETGSQEIPSEFIRKIPGAMNDPVRALGFSPGVMVQNDLNVRPYVRGGDADETRVVLDGIPLLQPYHVGGVFSLFNLNTLESVELYRDDFPADDPGALSGILRLKTKRLSPDRAHAAADVSLVRGDAFAEAPVIANRWSVYGAAQTFLFNQSLHGLINAASEVSRDSLFQRDIQSYRDHVNLPEFQDYHWGTTYSPSENLRIQYHGGYSTDAYAVVVPSQTNILTGPVTDPPLIPATEIKRSQKLSVDSISSVDIDNQAHFLNLGWDLNPENFLESNFGIPGARTGRRLQETRLQHPAVATRARLQVFSLSDYNTPIRLPLPTASRSGSATTTSVKPMTRKFPSCCMT